MLDSKLLTQTIYDDREGFVVTEQGLEFLKKHSELVNLLKNPQYRKKRVFSSRLNSAKLGVSVTLKR